MLTDVRTQTGSRFEYEAYDVGHLYTLAYYLDAGLVEPPIFLQTIMGVMGGIGAERRASRPHEVDRGPAARGRLRVVGAGRRAPPVRDDHRLRGDGLPRPGRSRGRPLHRAGASSPSRTPSRSRRSGGSSTELSLEIATPDEARADPRAQGPRPGRLVSRRGRPPPDAVRTVAVVGTGVIGGGWAAHFLRRGYDVVAWDPGPDAASGWPGCSDTAWPSLERLGLCAGASRDRLRLGGHARGGARGRRLRPGVLARGARGQGRPARGDRPADRPGGRGRLEHVGPDDDRHGGGVPTPRSVPGRSPVQPAVPDPAGRGRRRPQDRPRGGDLGRGVLHASPARPR